MCTARRKSSASPPPLCPPCAVGAAGLRSYGTGGRSGTGLLTFARGETLGWSATPRSDPSGTTAEPMARTDKSALQWVRASEHTPRRIAWLWPKFVPRAELTIFEGKKKIGKSSALGAIAAAVTLGTPMPDGSGASEPATVIWITGEESIDAVTLRLEDCGAHMERVLLLSPESRRLTAADAEGELLELIVSSGVALVIIDPIKSFLRGDDSDEIGVRSQLLGFARAAQSSGAAIVVTRHWTKGARAADERGGGSISYGAVARSVLGVGRSAGGLLAMFVIESSNVRAGHAMTFELVGDEDSGRPPTARFHERTRVDPDEIALAEPVATRRERRTKVARAEDALVDLLSGGPVPSREAHRRVAESEGVSERVVQRAAQTLGVVYDRSEFGPDTVVVARLPAGEEIPGDGRHGATVETAFTGLADPHREAAPPAHSGASVPTASRSGADVPAQPAAPAPVGATGTRDPSDAEDTPAPCVTAGATGSAGSNGHLMTKLAVAPASGTPDSEPAEVASLLGIPEGVLRTELRGGRWVGVDVDGREVSLHVRVIGELRERRLLGQPLQ